MNIMKKIKTDLKSLEAVLKKEYSATSIECGICHKVNLINLLFKHLNNCLLEISLYNRLTTSLEGATP